VNWEVLRMNWERWKTRRMKRTREGHRSKRTTWKMSWWWTWT
jgi:hypothetical protein